MSNRTVLVSGAGIAGTTLAYWLAWHGFRPTVVERGLWQRASGNPVDVRGQALRVAERMGITARLRAARTNVSGMRFVDAAGNTVGRINLRALARSTGGQDVELPRGALAAILQEASADHAEFVFGDSVAGIAQDDNGVEVTFEHGRPRRFDLVVGADGLHSAVRGLAFGPERNYARHLGLYLATVPFAGPAAHHEREVVMHNTPGRAVALHPTSDGQTAFFAFRRPELADFNHRDIEQHRLLLAAAFGTGSWRTPELLARAYAAEDLYFDAVSQVQMPSWSSGRVTLVGDAACCVSLFGDGSSLAMAGAFALAEELAATPNDHRAALRRYEGRHRRLVDRRHRGVDQASHLLIPATWTGIRARNAATRLWPAAAAAGWVGSRLAPGGLPLAPRTTRPAGATSPS
ncbi:putative oxidoreductase (Partial match) [Frankia canadensis]|uniref:Putative oxidoreductase (Partial match) n=1 Tax=Frankia canadensis TaxID=1836972 RepID=A0A2I2L1M8_9ACTN|nr:FAD-dependent monooxygenase [Frankia canadensis]SNQ51805.1 putative oxidoreductase (Partial match) [Frankia canadensis]SOU59095.1 putative oxidoreductase (Partial match) [Frankia canadensis]